MTARSPIESSQTLWAHWAYHTVTVLFNPNKGECDVDGVEREYGTAIGALPTPTRKEECQFLGWFTQRVGGERVSATTRAISDMTLWAHWKPTRYDWRYTADNANGTARIDGVTPNLEGAVTLPKVVDGYRVASIGDSAFLGHDELSELTIQSTVTNIEANAFANCSGLSRIVIPASVEHVSGSAFTGCYGVLSAVTPGWFGGFIPSTLVTNAVISAGAVRVDDAAYQNRNWLTDVSIPDSVRRVGLGAFSNCHEDLYDTVTRPGLVLVDGWVVGYDAEELGVALDLDLTGLRGVADGAFEGCQNLVHVTIPTNFTCIGYGAFRNCLNLEGVSIPRSVTEILPFAFSGCTALEGVALPSGLRGIGAAAFGGCEGLQNISIPAGVTNIAEEAFRACANLSNVAILSTNCVFGQNAFGQCFSLREATLSQAVLDVTLQAAFPGAYRNITNVVFAAGVTNISNGAFADCTGLPSLSIPYGVWRIGNNAFNGCTALTNVSNAADVEIIGTRAFLGSGLRSFTMPASVTNVLSAAFRGCVDLLRVDAADIQAWCRIRFVDRDANPAGLHAEPDRHCDLYSDGKIVQNLTVPAHVDVLGPFTFAENTNLVSVMALSGLTAIDGSAFWGCPRIADVTLPEGVLTIGPSAFEGCTSLDNLIIPASVTEISDFAFAGCTELSHLTMMETREGIENSSRIGASAFDGCTALTTATIPSRMTTFGAAVFANCDHLKSIYYLGDYAPILEAGATDIYRNTPTVMLTYVMKDSMGWVDGSSDLPTVWPDNAVNGRGIRVMPQVTCTVTFDGNGASGKIPEARRDAGQLLGNFPTPVRKGYSFDGWFTAKTGGAQVSDNSVVTANVVLYAHWTLLPIYDITFDANGGSGTTTVGISKGEKLGSFPSVSRYGYSAAGWWTSASGGKQVSVDTVVSGAATYWVHWKKNVYDVKLDANGGSGTETRKVEHGAAVGTLPSLTRTGYAFNGWWTSASGGSQASSAMAIYGATTLWAHWTAKSYAATFDSADGSGVATRTIGHGSKLGNLPTPERANYEFDGWWTAAVGGTRISPDTVVTGPITLWAHWIDKHERLYEAVEGTFDGINAAVYTGWIYDSKDNVRGTITLKAAKMSPRRTIKLTATLLTTDNRKLIYKGEIPYGSSDVVLTSASDTRQLALKIGSDALGGSFDSWSVTGSRNVFTSKAAQEKALSAAVLAQQKQPIAVAMSDGGSWSTLSLSVGTKGKVKISGTTSLGTRVSASSQLLIGEKSYAIPVVVQKKANIAFVLWITSSGIKVEREGVQAGRVGSLAANAKFHVDGAKIASAWGQTVLPYLPDGVSVEQVGTKWIVAGGAKAGKLSMKAGVFDDSRAGTNPSGLKLTYKAKDGSFKGSFKVYADNGGKLKSASVNVTGVLVGGTAYASAVVRGGGSVAVTIK